MPRGVYPRKNERSVAKTGQIVSLRERTMEASPQEVELMSLRSRVESLQHDLELERQNHQGTALDALRTIATLAEKL